MEEAPYAFVIVQLDDGPRCTGWMPYVKKPEDTAIGDRVRFVKTFKPGMVFEKADRVAARLTPLEESQQHHDGLHRLEAVGEF